jgi:uncharacterized protein
MSGLVVSPFDRQRYVGSVCTVRPATVEVNLPFAPRPGSTHVAGYPLQRGQVGEFVVIEGEEHAVLGRLVETRLPERDRLSVEPTHEPNERPNPVGVVQLLTAVDLETGTPLRGIPISPRIGQHVFSAHPLVVKQVVEAGGTTPQAQRIYLARFPHARDIVVSLSPSQLLGRHCAVLGGTGGGKSWTLALLVEEISRLGGKAILFDATGEFQTQIHPGITHAHLGGRKVDQNDPRRFLSFPYWELTESDLFVLLRPSPGVQAPKLKEALRSLKIAQLSPGLAANGLIRKLNAPRQLFEAACVQHGLALRRPGTLFDIGLLSSQIWEECVYPAGFGAQAANWGGVNANEQSACATLMSRIESELASPNLECLFAPTGLEPLPGVVEAFLADPAQRVLRISLEFLSFEHNAREVVANAVGRYLLGLARQGRFLTMPVVTLLDEAHQFLDKSVGDEFSRTDLDAFSLIAKEGRKYSLTCVLATQRPRDIPEDVLSQMGMFIVHRLINERDRNVVEKACGDLDASAAAFLPTLGQGEAMVVGVSSPMPLPVAINRPARPPSSSSADYENLWG